MAEYLELDLWGSAAMKIIFVTNKRLFKKKNHSTLNKKIAKNYAYFDTGEQDKMKRIAIFTYIVSRRQLLPRDMIMGIVARVHPEERQTVLDVRKKIHRPYKIVIRKLMEKRIIDDYWEKPKNRDSIEKSKHRKKYPKPRKQPKNNKRAFNSGR